MLVIGEKEAAAGSVSVRLRHGGDAGVLSIAEFLAAVRRAIEEKQSDFRR
jgi:threonyl-tRNA synthetase